MFGAVNCLVEEKKCFVSVSKNWIYLYIYIVILDSNYRTCNSIKKTINQMTIGREKMKENPYLN